MEKIKSVLVDLKAGLVLWYNFACLAGVIMTFELMRQSILNPSSILVLLKFPILIGAMIIFTKLFFVSFGVTKLKIGEIWKK